MPKDDEFQDMLARAFIDRCVVGESVFVDDDGRSWVLSAKPMVFMPSLQATYILLPRDPKDPYCILAGKKIKAQLVKLKPKPESPTLEMASTEQLLARIIEVADDLDNHADIGSPEEFAAQALLSAAKACLRHYEADDYGDCDPDDDY